MGLVINHFTHVLDFTKFDQGHTRYRYPSHTIQIIISLVLTQHFIN